MFKSQCSNDLICFIELCGNFFSFKLHFTKLLGKMALKLDINKAYNRVEWICLDKIMEKLGFNLRWRGLMMQCISFVIYFVHINGKPRGCISLPRGLHQGDHFSPYLFLICVEGLFALIKQFVYDGSMDGVSICRGGMSISHFFFSLMIVSFSARLLWRNVNLCKEFFMCMRKLPANI